MNIYDLGLIYGIEIGDDGTVKIDMTLTAPACPVAGIMPQQAAEAVAAVEGVGTVELRLVWEPPWTRDRMTDEAKLALDLF
ncbi:MAG: iron-sulfur cluster assembly protein [Alphaproteobacteria bacterium]